MSVEFGSEFRNMFIESRRLTVRPWSFVWYLRFQARESGQPKLVSCQLALSTSESYSIPALTILERPLAPLPAFIQSK